MWIDRYLLRHLPASCRCLDLALFNLAIDSKLRACDLVAISVADVAISGRVRDRAIIIQRKTGRPVQFELTDQTREAVGAWIRRRRLGERDYLFPSRVHAKPHLSTRQYGRIVARWVSSIGLDPKRYGTHSMKTGNLRAVQLLLGHKKLESTVQYLGIEVDDALAISEQVEL